MKLFRFIFDCTAFLIVGTSNYFDNLCIDTCVVSMDCSPTCKV